MRVTYNNQERKKKKKKTFNINKLASFLSFFSSSLTHWQNPITLPTRKLILEN